MIQNSEIAEHCRKRIEDLRTSLETSPGNENFDRGMISAYRDILDKVAPSPRPVKETKTTDPRTVDPAGF